jgi:hypothetical protein
MDGDCGNSDAMTGAATAWVCLWTVQHRGAWERAQRRGSLRGDGRFVPRGWRPAYRWMRRQMTLRGCAPRARRYSALDDLALFPVWAWYRPRPHVRRAGHLPADTPGVRVEFVAPAHRVLLSDFAAWHCILNDGYLAWDEAEDADFRSRHGGRTRPRERTPGCQAEVEASWERIFDLAALSAAPRWGPCRCSNSGRGMRLRLPGGGPAMKRLHTSLLTARAFVVGAVHPPSSAARA